MAKLKLDMDPDPEITVIGISSHVHDYRLCWAVNMALGLSLTRRRKNIEEEIDGILATYSAYDHVDPESQARYTLINNHSGDGILLREQRQADYFLVVDNELAEQHPDLVGRLRSAELVLTAFEIPFDDLREGHKLLL